MKNLFMNNDAAGTLFKENLRSLIRDKLRDLGDYPTYITSEVKNQIADLKDDFLELEQTKKFNEDRGVDMLKEIDQIYKELYKLRLDASKKKIDKEEEEDRKRKPTSSKSKRKVCKCKNKR